MDTKAGVLNFLQLNTDKSLASTLQILEIGVNKGIDVICLQEPYFHVSHTHDNVKYFTPPDQYNYQCFYVNNSTKPMSAIYVKKSINAFMMSKMSSSYCVTVSIPMCKSTIHVSSVYSPPSDDCPINRFDPLILNSSNNILDNTIICTDANSKSSLWGSSFTDSKGSRFESFLLGNRMNVINSQDSLPTFDSGRGVSWIDVTAAGHKIYDKISCWRIEDISSLSFHKILSFQMKSISKEKSKNINLRRTDWDQFNSILSHKMQLNHLSEKLENLDQIEDTISHLDSVNDIFSNLLQSSLKESTPSPKEHNHRSCPWWNHDLSKMRKENNVLRRKSQRSGSQEDKSRYRCHLNKYKSAIRHAKWTSFKDFCQNCTDPHSFASKVLKPESNSSVPQLRKSDGNITEYGKETAEYLLDNFFPDDSLNDEEQWHQNIRNRVKDYLESVNHLNSSVPNITSNELNCIFEWDPFKASSDILLPIVFQKSFNTIKEFILKLFNICLKESIYLENWKRASVIILQKPGKTDYENFKSYRPISLLPIMGKWFSKIISKRLMWESEQNDWINPKQFGFRKNSSCEDALIRMTDIASKAIAEKKLCLVISLDISGAFDSAWHPGILNSLINVQCQPEYIKLFENFLSNRSVSLNI